MELRAFFDATGRVYVARATDTEWINERKAGYILHGTPILDALNEFSGEIVTPEEVNYNFRYAIEEFNVEPFYIIYIDEVVKEYCLSF